MKKLIAFAFLALAICAASSTVVVTPSQASSGGAPQCRNGC